MLDLELRDEFVGRKLKGTAIEFSNRFQTGATQIDTTKFLEITYPTYDLLKGIEALGSNEGRPIVVIGERGLGKSHLMATLYHAVQDKVTTTSWLASWASQLKRSDLHEIHTCSEMFVIGESLHRQKYRTLWEILFDRHPNGSQNREKWRQQDTPVPSYDLIIEMLENKPLLLLLDEFQTWYDGLSNSPQSPRKAWAFNFTQILTEIAKERPDLLVLVVSVRNGESDAYKQIHRLNPVYLDFKSAGTLERVQTDRRRMLLHRLFKNRNKIYDKDIEKKIETHISEHVRLRKVALQEQDSVRQQFVDSWPFAPSLLRLLEDQVLVATDAQETRDLIRILANLFKTRKDTNPILTAGDINLEDDHSGIGALLDSVANEHHRNLREKARRNLTSILEATQNENSDGLHFREIMGALWLRSIAIKQFSGATGVDIQLDITKEHPIDDNYFQLELTQVVENSFNIHFDNGNYIFKESDNPQAKLTMYARNEKLFEDNRDKAFLSEQMETEFNVGTTIDDEGKVIVLPHNWREISLTEYVRDKYRPGFEGMLKILVVPESPHNINEILAGWLKENVEAERNSYIFLLPPANSENIFTEKNFKLLGRMVLLAGDWKNDSTEYRKLRERYLKELRKKLKEQFTRLVSLRSWNFTDTAMCEFYTVSVSDSGSGLVDSVRKAILKDLYVVEDAREIILASSQNNYTIERLVKELQEPRALGQDCVPWVGISEVKNQVAQLYSEGKLAINYREKDLYQKKVDQDQGEAKQFISRILKSVTGRYIGEVTVIQPVAEPSQSDLGEDAIFGEGGKDASFQGSELVEEPRDSVFDELAMESPISVLEALEYLEKNKISGTTRLHELVLKVNQTDGQTAKDTLKRFSDDSTVKLSFKIMRMVK